MSYRVVADLGLCQGHQLCQGEAPDIFDVDDDTDLVIVLNPTPPEERRADVVQAVKYCPAFALSIDEED